ELAADVEGASDARVEVGGLDISFGKEDPGAHHFEAAGPFAEGDGVERRESELLAEGAGHRPVDEPAADEAEVPTAGDGSGDGKQVFVEGEDEVTVEVERAVEVVTEDGEALEELLRAEAVHAELEGEGRAGCGPQGIRRRGETRRDVDGAA